MSYPVVTAVALHTAFLVFWVASVFQGDVSGLVCTSRGWAGRTPFEAVRPWGGEGGFDGQFYYAIAQNPWQRWDGFPHCIDHPAYRHQRIIYPALAWLCSGGGDPQRLLWAMPAINLAAVGVLTYLGVRTARHFGRNEWWALLLPVAVNATIPMLRDLTDLVAVCAVAGFLVGWLLDWPWWSLALWAAAAVFAREQNAAVLVFGVAAALWTKRYRAALGLCGVLALWGGWIFFLRWLYGRSPFLESGVFEPPLTGLFQCWTNPNGFYRREARLAHLLYMSGFTAQIGLCFWMAVRKGERLIAAVGVLGAVFALLAGWTFTYNDLWSYGRVFAWIPLAVWLNGMRAQQRWTVLTTLPAVSYPLLFLYPFAHAYAHIWGGAVLRACHLR
jgi:hypothetical protein